MPPRVLPHHTDRYGIQWLDVRETKILNTITNRYVERESVVGKRLLRGRLQEQGGVLRNFTKVSENTIWRDWTERKYESTGNQQSSLDNFTTRLLRVRQNNLANEFIVLFFFDRDGRLVERKSMKFQNANGTRIGDDEIRRKLRTLAYDGGRANIDSFGSDDLREHSLLDTSRFVYHFKRINQGGGGHDYDTYKNDLFRSRSKKSTGENCFFMIIKHFMSIKEHCNTIRKEFGIEEGVKIPIEQMSLFEDHYNININVYSPTNDYDVSYENGDVNKPTYHYHYLYKSDKPTKGRKGVLNMTLFNDHYFEIHTFNKIKIKKTKINALEKKIEKQENANKRNKNNIHKKQIYLFFDIETIFELTCQSFLKPYSISWFAIEADKEFVYTEECMTNKTHFEFGFKCMKKFVDFIKQCPDDSYYTLIGYNSSRFDNFILLNHYVEEVDEFVKPFFAGGSILKLRIGDRHDSFDLVRFVNAELKDACKKFKTNPVKLDGFSHVVIQNLYNHSKHNFETKMKEKLSELKLYNKTDVLSTVSLFYKVRNAIKEACNMNITDSMTLASLSYNYINTFPEFQEIEPAKNYEDDKKFRQAVIGGRCETKYGKKYSLTVDDNVMVDCTSLYPYVMINRRYPIGEYEQTDTYVEGKLGIYECVVKQLEDKPNSVPKRGLTLDWKNKEEFNITLTSVDIECLKKHGHGVVVGKGHYWEKSSNKVFSQLKVFEEKKKQQDEYGATNNPLYNAALREMYKLILNSLSGKVIQRNYTETSQLINNEEEMRKFQLTLDKENKSVEFSMFSGNKIYVSGNKSPTDAFKNPKPAFIGCFIYAYAREHMYSNMIYPLDVLYTDTDSALISVKDYAKVPKNLLGNDFGQFKEELTGIDKKTGMKARVLGYYLIAPKFYHVMNSDSDKVKMKIKGVNKNDKIISKEQAENIDDLTPEEKFKLYYEGGLEKAYSSKTFEKIFKNEDVYVLCSQLRKEIFKQNCNVEISQKFLAKCIYVHDGMLIDENEDDE